MYKAGDSVWIEGEVADHSPQEGTTVVLIPGFYGLLPYRVHDTVIHPRFVTNSDGVDPLNGSHLDY